MLLMYRNGEDAGKIDIGPVKRARDKAAEIKDTRDKIMDMLTEMKSIHNQVPGIDAVWHACMSVSVSVSVSESVSVYLCICIYVCMHVHVCIFALLSFVVLCICFVLVMCHASCVCKCMYAFIGILCISWRK